LPEARDALVQAEQHRGELLTANRHLEAEAHGLQHKSSILATENTAQQKRLQRLQADLEVAQEQRALLRDEAAAAQRGRAGAEEEKAKHEAASLQASAEAAQLRRQLGLLTAEGEEALGRHKAALGSERQRFACAAADLQMEKHNAKALTQRCRTSDTATAAAQKRARTLELELERQRLGMTQMKTQNDVLERQMQDVSGAIFSMAE
jgi:chromosome segregation ATPase